VFTSTLKTSKSTTLPSTILDSLALRALSDMLAAHRGVRSRASLEQVAMSTEDGEGAVAPLVVLPSSTELFYFYAQSLESCANLAAGSDKVLLDLAKVHGKWLKVYAGECSHIIHCLPTDEKCRRRTDQ
jgi:hypothetical protein